MKKICSFLSVLLLVALGAVAAALIGPKLLGYGQYAVLTGSMEPGIQVGSIVCDKSFDASDETDVDALFVGEIITYRIGSETLVTHRIIEINEEDETVTTQGDANNAADGSPVAYSSIVGTYAFHIPYLGYISMYSRTPLGISAVCGVLVLIILLNFLPELFAKEGHEES
jgi:signal peptidase